MEMEMEMDEEFFHTNKSLLLGIGELNSSKREKILV